jgi:hypothetical protein
LKLKVDHLRARRTGVGEEYGIDKGSAGDISCARKEERATVVECVEGRGGAACG